ncbi:phage tail terminator family protein [Cohnella sp. JJ-181]|uniref:phage tail terminator family protein n=1 Tax=Cohnella rhizoplanae TaxID=2974897 RepID=UPI0022FF5DA7|nr:hypothetical protein [Cohnella sp. JJ-181]CAI6087176.1 hypothetical protein COHCIP112018_05368 [Cohnella sp. JJ-181]
MSTITINDVRDAVVGALVDSFPTIKVSDEEIKQGLGPRRFYVKLLDADQQALVGNRYRREHSFDVHYFGPNNAELNDVAEQLYDVLELMPTPGGDLRGIRMRHETVDEVLHFFFIVQFRIARQPSSGPMMQTLIEEVDLIG